MEPDPRGAIKGRGRVLNLRDHTAGVPELILCPRCEGQAFDKGSCAMCGNADGTDAFHAWQKAIVDAGLALVIAAKKVDPNG